MGFGKLSQGLVRFVAKIEEVSKDWNSPWTRHKLARASPASAFHRTVYLLCLLTFLCFFVTRRRSASSKLPPGPRRLPIIGNLLDLGDEPHRSMAELARTHGPIMSLKLGSIMTVVVSSATAARQVLQTNDLVFCNRTVGEAARIFDHHELSTPWLPVSPLWRNLRKTFNQHVFPSNKHDAIQHLKVKQFVSSLRLGEVIDLGEASFNIVLNILSNIAFSMDLADLNSQRARDFKNTVQNVMKELTKPNLADNFPLLRRFDPQGVRRRTTLLFDNLFRIVEEIYDERVQLRKRKGYATNDVLDTLIAIVEDENQELEKKHILHLLLDLFIAGTDTTSSILECAMAELLHNPKTLLKAKAELEAVIGKGQLVKESELNSLPYLRAIVKETLRSNSPFLLPRRAGADTEINGFTIPEGAQVIVNVWAISNDPSVWENPDCFMPERFLGSDIDVKGGNFELIPFGAGRRICPGMNRALSVVPSVLGSLINCFDWKLEDGVTPENMNMEKTFGITLHKTQPLRAIPVPLC